MSRGEGFALALDFNLDVKAALELGSDAPPFDFMLGVPAGQVRRTLFVFFFLQN